MSGLDLHELGALDAVHSAYSPGKGAASLPAGCKETAPLLPVLRTPRSAPELARERGVKPTTWAYGRRTFFCKLSIASGLRQRSGNSNSHSTQRQRHRPREGKKVMPFFSVEGIALGGYRYAHPSRSTTPHNFQYHFCKWHCVLPVLLNTVVSPTYRYTHTHMWFIHPRPPKVSV